MLRSVPELVWALVVVRVVGLGPAAGVLAITLTCGGMLGKVDAEILESGEAQLPQTLLRTGGTGLQAFAYGLLPQNAAELTGYSFYRWECAIRTLAVLGVEGAGGLGQMVSFHMSLFQMHKPGTVLIAMLLLEALVDIASFASRRWLKG